MWFFLSTVIIYFYIDSVSLLNDTFFSIQNTSTLTWLLTPDVISN